jgi:ribosomal protein L3 glutamine methyltransferase
MAAELNTALDFIRWGERQFRAAKLYFGHGTDNAWDEAVFLVLHALQLPFNTEQKLLKVKLTAQEKKAVHDILQRRIKERKPAVYLTNSTYFAGFEFYVDERVLIPRSPIAELIERQFVPWIAEPQKVRRILDLGTGSGCLAIASAYAFPWAEVDAVDISTDALAVAKINVERHNLVDRVHLIHSDVFAGLCAANGAAATGANPRYDIIVSNPPYVALEEMQDLPHEYKHEPEMALVADRDGLLFVDRILATYREYLAPRGVLIVEVGNSAAALVAKYPRLPFIWLEFERGMSEVFLLLADTNVS